MVFLELRRDSRVTTGNSGCLSGILGPFPCVSLGFQSYYRLLVESLSLSNLKKNFFLILFVFGVTGSSLLHAGLV